jgi:hypothetical protein
LERRFCVIGKRYSDLVKPQRDPHLNLTGQGYRAASAGQEQGENYRRLHAKLAVLIVITFAACSPDAEMTGSTNKCAADLYPSYNPKLLNQCVDL